MDSSFDGPPDGRCVDPEVPERPAWPVVSIFILTAKRIYTRRRRRTPVDGATGGSLANRCHVRSSTSMSVPSHQKMDIQPFYATLHCSARTPDTVVRCRP
mgnify:CR=1 FL=1